MIAAFIFRFGFLRDALDARAAQLTPCFGDNRAAAVHRHFLEAGRLGDDKLPQQRQHFRQTGCQVLEQESGVRGVGHGRDIVTAATGRGNGAQAAKGSEELNESPPNAIR